MIFFFLWKLTGSTKSLGIFSMKNSCAQEYL